MEIKTLEAKVRKVLAEDEKSRNSDIRLTQMIWWRFYQPKMRQFEGKTYVGITDLFELPREDNIKRVRARIQNVEKKFLPTNPEVAKKRGWKIEEWREYLGYRTGDHL